MKFILDQSNLKALESLGADAVYAFDFDGTLSSIVANYSDAKANDAVNELMIKLCNLVPVAIISGRSVADLKKIINFSPKFLIGNHGMEGILSKTKMDAIEIKSNELRKIIMDSFSERFMDAGIEIEDKKFSFSVHYRNAKDPWQAEMLIYEGVKLLPKEVGIIKGKYVLNILPSTEINKGFALSEILNIEKKKYSFFIGDDDTDEDVFELNDPYSVTVRVGESPSSKAKYFINSQSEIELLLSKIISFLN